MKLKEFGPGGEGVTCPKFYYVDSPMILSEKLKTLIRNVLINTAVNVKRLTNWLKFVHFWPNRVKETNWFKNPIKLAFFTIFVYFLCISSQNLFIWHKFH